MSASRSTELQHLGLWGMGGAQVLPSCVVVKSFFVMIVLLRELFCGLAFPLE